MPDASTLPDWLSWLVSPGRLAASADLLGNPALLWTLVISHALIGLAFLSIPVTLVVLVRKRVDLQFNWVAKLFTAFLLLSAATHFAEVWTAWHPDHWLAATITAITAVVSLLTAALVWPLIPKAMNLPSVERQQDLIASLQKEVVVRTLAEQRAEQASQAKTQFLSSISHELRTPLNAVLGFAQLLEIDPKAPLTDDQRVRVRHIQQAGRHLLSMINDVLDLSAIESGKLRLEIAELELPPLLDECKAMLGAQIGEKRLGVATEIGNDLPRVQADPTRLRQVLNNLLSNAVKYNVPDGRIRIGAYRHSGRVLIEVEDSGIGMNEQQQKQLFQPFNRLGRERMGLEGAGIGLVVTRKLVEVMGGELTVTSHEGIGSTFGVWLPASAGHHAPAP